MIHTACILIGLYLAFNAVYLGSQSEHETRHCLIAKYVGAGMSGCYLVWLSANDLVFYLVLENRQHLFISDDAMQILLLLGVTIALFMWPDTFWRILDFLAKKNPPLHLWLVNYFNVSSRRMRDRT
jgi:hypothetical protein